MYLGFAVLHVAPFVTMVPPVPSAFSAASKTSGIVPAERVTVNVLPTGLGPPAQSPAVVPRVQKKFPAVTAVALGPTQNSLKKVEIAVPCAASDARGARRAIGKGVTTCRSSREGPVAETHLTSRNTLAGFLLKGVCYCWSPLRRDDQVGVSRADRSEYRRGG